jgi:hypothetical protein
MVFLLGFRVAGEEKGSLLMAEHVLANWALFYAPLANGTAAG